jgi:hypothetical protein
MRTYLKELEYNLFLSFIMCLLLLNIEEILQKTKVTINYYLVFRFAGAVILQQFFTPEVVTGIGKTLITKYMITSSEDLEVWSEDPEGKWEFMVTSNNIGFVAEELQGDTKHQIKVFLVIL